MQLKTLLKHAILIVVITGSMLFVVLLLIFQQIPALAYVVTTSSTSFYRGTEAPIIDCDQGGFRLAYYKNSDLSVPLALSNCNDSLNSKNTLENFDQVLNIPAPDVFKIVYTTTNICWDRQLSFDVCLADEGVGEISIDYYNQGTPTPTPSPTPPPTSTPTPTPTSTPATARSSSSSSSSSSPSTGTINVAKTVLNDNGGTKIIADFPLFVNGQLVVSGQTNNFSAGSVLTVTETGDPDYALTFSGDCDSNGQLNLNVGDNKFCVVTNDDIGAPVVNPPVPPLIDLVKVPSPLALPNGPGPVTYTYTLSNIGTVPVTNITMTGDTCSPINLVYGDINGDSKLDVNEAWTYRCSTTLSATHTNTITATGWANGISVVDIATATVVVGVPGLPDTGLPAKVVIPPLIHVVKVPSPLTLPVGGGIVTYTERVTNPGTVALSKVNLTDDKCSPLKYVFGDVNKNSKLDITETWIYTCSINLIQTTTNTANVSGVANGLTAKDFAVATVVVAPGVPLLPDAGFTYIWYSDILNIILAGILAIIILLCIVPDYFKNE